MTDLQQKADRIAKHIGQPPMSWEATRDLVDMGTAGDCNTIELDILTDMVLSRLKKGAGNVEG